MNTITKKLTFGLPLDDELKAQAENMKGFVKFIDDEYFEVEVESFTEEDFVYFKRKNGQIVVV